MDLVLQQVEEKCYFFFNLFIINHIVILFYCPYLKPAKGFYGNYNTDNHKNSA
jgi:hypothetical protein